MKDPEKSFPFIVQFAGFHDLEEARLAIQAGADLIGIPLRLTVNAEDCDSQTAKSISEAFPDKTCLITYLNQASDIINLAEEIAANWVQLHGEVSLNSLRELRRLSPDLKIIKSLIVGKYSESELLTQVNEIEPFVDCFITDSYDSNSGAEGATGLTHDWCISRKLVNHSHQPVILAGGLNAENVTQSITSAQPAGVDAHTGVEGPDGKKCFDKMKAFVDAARRAQLSINT